MGWEGVGRKGRKGREGHTLHINYTYTTHTHYTILYGLRAGKNMFQSLSLTFASFLVFSLVFCFRFSSSSESSTYGDIFTFFFS